MAAVACNTNSIYYELLEAAPLPTIDCEIALKMVLFASHPTTLHTWNGLVQKTHRISFGIWTIGALFHIAVMFVDAFTGEICSLVSLVLICIPSLICILSMRYDMIRLLSLTYEFWYITVINCMIILLMSLSFGDWRALIAFATANAAQQGLMLDAFKRSGKGRAALISTMITSSGMVSVTFYTLFHLIRDTRNVPLVRSGDWTLHSDDLLANCLGTLSIVMLRNAYRKYQQYKVERERINSGVLRCRRIVRCMSYYTRLRYVETVYRPPTDNPSSSVVPITIDNVPVVKKKSMIASTSALKSSANTISQLKLVPIMNTFDAQRLVKSTTSSLLYYSRLVRRISQSIAIIGMSATCLNLLTFTQAQTIWWGYLSIVAISGTSIYFIFCTLHQHRGLLFRLMSSFDFVFVTLQATAADLTVAYLLHWDHRCLVIFASWLWTIWIVALDGLTPVIKRQLGLTPIWLLWIALVTTTTNGYIWMHLLWADQWRVLDRVMIDFEFREIHIKLSALPFFFSRVLTLSTWGIRLCWRLKDTLGDPALLLMLQAPVEYEDKNMRQVRKIIARTWISIRPGSQRFINSQLGSRHTSKS